MIVKLYSRMFMLPLVYIIICFSFLYFIFISICTNPDKYNLSVKSDISCEKTIYDENNLPNNWKNLDSRFFYKIIKKDGEKGLRLKIKEGVSVKFSDLEEEMHKMNCDFVQLTPEFD